MAKVCGNVQKNTEKNDLLVYMTHTHTQKKYNYLNDLSSVLN